MWSMVLALLERLTSFVERCSERRRLMSLDDRMLHDIGRSRADAEAEWAKPFWRD